ncbi:DUF2971 domain-containing protein [Chromobacterium haemolyticum]|uniref:DUF2971 domain-containing protein n=1 Tax=Chromobacterium haemolyticum TaxID=394935 RepID=UPI000DEF8561|nr:DUF2971 domain-containing protein [Chromobacterium haemolyticum]
MFDKDMVFKFMSFSEYSFRSILNQELFFSANKYFNDPFENDFNVGFDIDGMKEESQEKIKRQLYEIASKTATFCTSRDYQNSLMWSHYTAQHGGFCLALSRSALIGVNEYKEVGGVEWKKIVGSLICRDMSYVKSPPKVSMKKCLNIHSKKGDFMEYVARETLFKKSQDWRYEEETRFVLVVGNIHNGVVVKLPVNVIKGVIFGCRATEENKSALRACLPKARFFQAKNSLGKSYKIECDEVY